MTWRTRILTLLLALGVYTAVTTKTSAQISGITNSWSNVGSGNWAVGGNWQAGTIPDANGELGFGDDFALIDNGGEAIVNSAVTDAAGAVPGGIGIGSADGTSGTLSISNGGTLEVIDVTPAFDGDGSVQVGLATSGLGVLNMTGNSQLIAARLVTGGAAGSTVSLQDAAQVTISGPANLNRMTLVRGNGVNFAATGDLTLGGSHQLLAEITSATHSPLKSSGGATVAGTLNVEFDGTPVTSTSSWSLVDAASITGDFSAITTSSSLGLGQVLNTRTTTTSTVNGSALELFVDQRLVLTVDRDSGIATVENPGGTAQSIDGLSVRSALGSLDNTAYTPLGTPWDPTIANPSANHVGQTVQSGSATVAASATTPLGSIFRPSPDSFGDETEDLALTYTKAGEGNIDGVVRYVGTQGINNLVLIVDPNSGEAQVRNTSPFSVDIDGYTVQSDSGSLSLAGWDSLEAQAAFGDSWDEANPDLDGTRLSELRQTGVTTLSPNSVGLFDLGSPFDHVSGEQDLLFQFTLMGESVARDGVVLYQAIPDPPAGVQGDYNDDGIVDLADYTVWRDLLGSNITLTNEGIGVTPGMVTIEDYSFWRSRFGATSGAGSGSLAASSAVPEPGGCLLLLTAFVLAIGTERSAPRRQD